MSGSGSGSDFENKVEETPRLDPVTNTKDIRLNRAILMKGISNVNCDKRESVEVDKQFPRVTHLHLQNKGIDILASFHHFRNLTVLYLYDNRIREIVGLEDLRHLEALYLQRNKLEKISGLLGCRKLRKIYLGQNAIQVVEGLHLLNHLEELHIEQQRLHKGDRLIFDPTTLENLSNCLQVLNISGNFITSLDDLAGMRDLHTVLAQDNAINDLEKTSLILMTLRNLKVVDLRQNPVAKSAKYEEKMIGHCQGIELLDGKTYSANSRQFMTKFCEMKALHLRRSLASMNIADMVTNSNTLTPCNDTQYQSKTMPSSNSTSCVQIDSSKQSFTTNPEQAQIDRHLARISTIGQYTDPYVNANSLNLAHVKKSDLKLIKPQEITLPQFSLAENSTSQTNTDGTDTSSQRLTLPKSTKSKIFKGLGSQGYGALTNLAPGFGTFGRLPAHAHSIEGMMPITQSITKIQQGATPTELNPYDNQVTTNTGQGDAEILSYARNPNPKVFKLPPWPHILRNLGTADKINFI